MSYVIKVLPIVKPVNCYNQVTKLLKFNMELKKNANKVKGDFSVQNILYSTYYVYIVYISLSIDRLYIYCLIHSVKR